MLITVILVILIYTITTRIQKKKRAERTGWKTNKKSHDTLIYSERVNGKWEEIEITRAYENGSFFIQFKDQEAWKTYPLWAQNRSQITQRMIRSYPDLAKRKNEIDEIGSHLKK